MSEGTKATNRYASRGEKGWSEERVKALRTCAVLALVLSVPAAWLAPDLLGINRTTFTVSASYAAAPNAGASLASSR
jgi:hypothetical protein